MVGFVTSVIKSSGSYIRILHEVKFNCSAINLHNIVTVHRPTDDPFYECDRCPCARFCDE
jgi:hypothetical protein